MCAAHVWYAYTGDNVVKLIIQKELYTRHSPPMEQNTLLELSCELEDTVVDL